MNRTKILKKECEELARYLKQIEDNDGDLRKMEDSKRLIGNLTKKMGGVFYGMCLFIDDDLISEEKIEKACVTRSKYYNNE